jgi:hypothetical protein
MKTVFVAENPAQAHLVAGLLEEQDIRCFIEGEMLFGARGDLGLTPSTLPKISVRDEDAPRATELIRAREAAAAADRETNPADPDATAPPPLPWRGVATILILWVLLAAVSTRYLGAIALPFVAVCLFIHVYLHFDRAS